MSWLAKYEATYGDFYALKPELGFAPLLEPDPRKALKFKTQEECAVFCDDLKRRAYLPLLRPFELDYGARERE